jgi:outer membrane lipoprotein-sorting protein
MNLFRRMSTLRLLLLGGAIAAVALVTGVVVARGSSGTTPAKKPLASALQAALLAKPPAGVSGRITFTNHLFPNGSLGQGGSALMNGASGRFWVSANGKFRLELQSSSGDTQILRTAQGVSVYDSSANTIYKIAAPSGSAAEQKSSSSDQQDSAGSSSHAPAGVSSLQSAIAQLAPYATISGAHPTNIAGQPAYTVRVSPKHDGGLLGAAEMGWDAQHGVPLKFAIYSRGDSSPVLALTVTEISYGAVSSNDLSVHARPGVKVVPVQLPQMPQKTPSALDKSTTGAAAVAKKLAFRLSAPATLVGLPRKTVRLVSAGESPSALAVYGQGLGAIVVFQQKAKAGAHDPLSALPRVSINGASGRELATALGTVLRFQRHGVTYTLVGSVPAVAAEAAARAL